MSEADLTFNAFAAANAARCESPQGFEKPLGHWSLSDWITATVGEFGEMANVAKKLNRVRDGIPGNSVSEPELRQMLADEIADTFIYLDLLCQSEGLSLADIVVSKFDKTSEKIGYPVRIAHCAPLNWEKVGGHSGVHIARHDGWEYRVAPNVFHSPPGYSVCRYPIGSTLSSDRAEWFRGKTGHEDRVPLDEGKRICEQIAGASS